MTEPSVALTWLAIAQLGLLETDIQIQQSLCFVAYHRGRESLEGDHVGPQRNRQRFGQVKRAQSKPISRLYITLINSSTMNLSRNYIILSSTLKFAPLHCIPLPNYFP